jgi:NhaP-type Na+/H+ or K+/H+ antiporter
MMIIGILVGLLHRGTNEGLGVLSDSIESWDHIDPHLLMFAFLPPLLFGDSMGLNYHHVKRCFWQCFLLAGPGVVIGTGLMGLVAKEVLPYDWDWKMSFCFASITAATDPVAVVGLLNSLGASQKLTMVIAGESLMNDGIAIVAFTLFKNLLHGKSYDFGGVVEFLFQVALGGPAVGIAFGLGALLTLIIIKNSSEGSESDNLANQTTLTFVTAYLAFFVGEEVCEVSGVLACVGSAVVIAAVGWPLLTARHQIHHVWHVVEFMANTIIFMLSGIIIASDIYDAYELDKTEAGKYFGYMLVVYIFMVLIRTVMMAIMYFPLANIGYGLERGWKDALVGVWGGLRGAIGLILCLIIDEDSTICNDGAPFVVLIGGATFYTLIINGTTTGPILRLLDMLKDPDAQAFLDFSIERRIHKVTKREFDRLLVDDTDTIEVDSSMADAAKTLIYALGDTWTETNRQGKKQMLELLERIKQAEGRNAKHGRQCEFLMVLRDLYLEMVRGEYNEFVEHQVIPVTSSIPEILLGSIDVALDEKETHIQDFDEIEKHLRIQWYHHVFDGSAFGRTVIHQFGRVVAKDRNAHVLTSYKRAHKVAFKKFEAEIGELKKLSLEQTKTQANDNTKILLTVIDAATEKIRCAHQKNLQRCEDKIDEMLVVDDSIKILNTKLLAAETLHVQLKELNSCKASSVLSKKGYDRMLARIQENIHEIQNRNLQETNETEEFANCSNANISASTISMKNAVGSITEDIQQDIAYIAEDIKQEVKGLVSTEDSIAEDSIAGVGGEPPNKSVQQL